MENNPQVQKHSCSAKLYYVPQNTPRTLQAHCQAQQAVKVIEKLFIGHAKELTIPTHVSPIGLLGFPDAQNKLFSVSSGQKNAFTINWIKFDTFTP